jgi:hypothetical protein
MNKEKLKALAAQGTIAFLTAIPHVALGALAGAAIRLVSMLGLGALLAFLSGMLWRGTELPAWLSASLFLTPIVLAIAGTYVGGVRGFLFALAQQLVDKKLVAYVYAQVKPAAVAALAKAKGGSAEELAAEVQRELVADDEQAENPSSLSERVAQFLTLHSRRVLALTLVTHVARAKTREEAAAEVEKLGLAKLEHIAVGQLEDLFSLKLTLITGAALLICIAPQLVFWFTR